MVDIVDTPTRSRWMSGIGGKNTEPERRLRNALHARGLRFRIHVAALPGTPDIVLPRFRAAVQVHGCFWHRHEGCRYATSPSTRPEFWQEKFSRNVARDRVKKEALLAADWRVATVWECGLRNQSMIDDITTRLVRWLESGDQSIELGMGQEWHLAPV